MGSRNLYDVLGVKPSATTEVITSAFRARVRELRPDIRVDAVTAERFGRLRAAYDTLRDPGLRAAYDRERAASRWFWWWAVHLPVRAAAAGGTGPVGARTVRASADQETRATT
ncbi:J domain-containing protein [Streptomyces sp. NBC_00490]|uniref:J domain-containing protein n=1 Tax=Streptomyces sp. NBC_00490 TaxID=2903657 RepID=UPI002E181BF8